jgi:hypothetical protein
MTQLPAREHELSHAADENPQCGFCPRDIEYVAAQLNLSENNFDFADYSDRTRKRHQPPILNQVRKAGVNIKQPFVGLHQSGTPIWSGSFHAPNHRDARKTFTVGRAVTPRTRTSETP